MVFPELFSLAVSKEFIIVIGDLSLFKWRLASVAHEQDDSKCEDVDLISFKRLPQKNFRRHVARGASFLIQ